MSTVSRKSLIAFLLSISLFLMIYAGIFIPVYGTDIIIDPGEIFIALGGVFAGTTGALAIALSRTAAKHLFLPESIQLASGAAHIAAALFIAQFYKLVIAKGKSTPRQLYLWILSMGIYYFLLLIPVFNFINYATIKEYYVGLFGRTDKGPWQPLLLLTKAAVPEFLFTSFATSIIIFSIPSGYRKP